MQRHHLLVASQGLNCSRVSATLTVCTAVYIYCIASYPGLPRLLSLAVKVLHASDKSLGRPGYEAVNEIMRFMIHCTSPDSDLIIPVYQYNLLNF